MCGECVSSWWVTLEFSLFRKDVWVSDTSRSLSGAWIHTHTQAWSLCSAMSALRLIFMFTTPAAQCMCFQIGNTCIVTITVSECVYIKAFQIITNDPYLSQGDLKHTYAQIISSLSQLSLAQCSSQHFSTFSVFCFFPIYPSSSFRPSLPSLAWSNVCLS